MCPWQYNFKFMNLFHPKLLSFSNRSRDVLGQWVRHHGEEKRGRRGRKPKGCNTPKKSFKKFGLIKLQAKNRFMLQVFVDTEDSLTQFQNTNCLHVYAHSDNKGILFIMQLQQVSPFIVWMHAACRVPMTSIETGLFSSA